MISIPTRRYLSQAAGMAAAVALTAGALIASTANAAPDDGPTVGQAAPAFTGTTSNGDTVSLADFAGKTVVLEWTNHGCPFVQKHYDATHANMQTLQSEADARDVVWLSVISSSPGKQGHVTGEEANDINAQRDAQPDHVILDVSGDIGQAYDAKTTPHMYVINGEGVLAYAGAIDSIPSARIADIPEADNYVMAALDAVASAEAPDPAATKPYGCSVKY